MKHQNPRMQADVLRGLVNFSATLNNILKEHLDSATVFKGTSKEIQNDLLDSMYQVCQEAIIAEISKCNFVSVMADERTDVSSKFQLVVVFHYTLKNGKQLSVFGSLSTQKTMIPLH